MFRKMTISHQKLKVNAFFSKNSYFSQPGFNVAPFCGYCAGYLRVLYPEIVFSKYFTRTNDVIFPGILRFYPQIPETKNLPLIPGKNTRKVLLTIQVDSRAQNKFRKIIQIKRNHVILISRNRNLSI